MQTTKRIKASHISVRRAETRAEQRYFFVELTEANKGSVRSIRSIYVSEEHAKVVVRSLDANCVYRGLVYNGSLTVQHSKDKVTVMIFVDYSPNEIVYADLSVEEFREFAAELNMLLAS